jgi:16S rRNA (cytosine967-C5)-methyltransferase
MKNGDEFVSVDQRPDYVSQINARSKIIDILTKVETRQAYSDKLLENELQSLEDLDKRFVTEVVNGVLRWRLRLDWYLDQLYLGEYDHLLVDVKNNLRSSVYQLIYLDKIPPYAVLYEAVEIAKAKYNQKTANLVNAILRNFLRQYKKFEFLETQLDVLDRLSFRYSHPKWLIQRWIEYWGVDEVRLLCEVNNQRPRLAVRINESIANRDEFFRILDANKILYEIHPEFKNFLWIDNFQDFRNLDLLSKGWVSVQDVSTALPILLLDPRPGEIVLDMCAAPGGKTGLIAEKMSGKGTLLALDRQIARLKTLKENLKRMQYSQYQVVTADSTKIPSRLTFDKILIDAPCSGFGVLSKRVDLKWKRSEQDIMNMKNLQLHLLDTAASILKSGGNIVYCTCTIEPEENEKNVHQFIAKHPEFELLKIRERIPEKYILDQYFVQTFPHKHRMDGSFAALLRKKSDQ